jgi:hypothetical protein
MSVELLLVIINKQAPTERRHTTKIAIKPIVSFLLRVQLKFIAFTVITKKQKSLCF